MRTFQEFASFSSISHNTLKHKITGIKSLKGVKIAVCGTKNIDLTKDLAKRSRISFSYNVAIQNELNFRTKILKIQTILELRGNAKTVT